MAVVVVVVVVVLVVVVRLYCDPTRFTTWSLYAESFRLSIYHIFLYQLPSSSFFPKPDSSNFPIALQTFGLMILPRIARTCAYDAGNIDNECHLLFDCSIDYDDRTSPAEKFKRKGRTWCWKSWIRLNVWWMIHIWKARESWVLGQVRYAAFQVLSLNR